VSIHVGSGVPTEFSVVSGIAIANFLVSSGL
jgi:hypothetical protein